MTGSLKILFVRPRPSALTIGLQHVMIVEPLELEVMAALTSPGDEVKIIDMILERKPIEFFIRNFNPDIFCITGYITHIPQIISYCRIAKSVNPLIITIAGGVHIEKCPDDCLDDAVDFRIVRNATLSFPKLLDFVKNGQSNEFPEGVLRNQDTVNFEKLPAYNFFFPLPRRDLTQQYRRHYFYVFHDRVALLKTSFGCPYRCSFCFCRKITGDHYFPRPIPEVIQELEGVKEREIYIVDDNFLYSPQRVREFIRELKDRKLNKRFLVYGRADFVARHPDIVREFRKEGLRTIIIGLESFDNKELEQYNKNLLSTVNHEALAILNDLGIDCYAAIILSPSWDRQDFKHLQGELKKLNVRFINLQPLTPLPETSIHVDERKLVIPRDSYPLWDLAHISIKPEKLSLEEYYSLIIQTYSRTLFRWIHLIHHLKYPMHLHWRMIKGVFKVYRQYRSILKASTNHA